MIYTYNNLNKHNQIMFVPILFIHNYTMDNMYCVPKIWQSYDAVQIVLKSSEQTGKEEAFLLVLDGIFVRQIGQENI